MLAVLGAAVAGCAQQDALMLRDMGSFHVGGRIAVVSGKPVAALIQSWLAEQKGLYR